MKSNRGRKLEFKTVAELQAKIDEYFDYCDNRMIKKVDKDGNEYAISNPDPYGVAGLSWFLGVDRKTINNYEARDEFFPAIKNAKARIEADNERRMLDKTTFSPGQIFNLKNNFGYTDQSQVDHTTGGKPINTFTDEQAERIARRVLAK